MKKPSLKNVFQTAVAALAVASGTSAVDASIAASQTYDYWTLKLEGV